MATLYFVLLALGLLCFLYEAFRVSPTRVNVLALGLAFWIAVSLLQLSQHS